MIINYRPLWTNGLKSSTKMNGRLFEAKKGYLTPGDTLRIVNHSGYVAPPKNWAGTEFEPWAKAYLTKYRHRRSAETELYATDWLRSADLVVTRIHKDGSYEGTLGDSRSNFGLDNEGNEGTFAGITSLLTLDAPSSSGGNLLSDGDTIVMSSTTGIHREMNPTTYNDNSVQTGATSEWGFLAYIKTDYNGSQDSIFMPYVSNPTLGTQNLISVTNNLYSSGGADTTLTPAQHLALLQPVASNYTNLLNAMINYNGVYDSSHPLHNTQFMIDVNNVAVSNSTMMLDADLSQYTNSSIASNIWDVVKNQGITLGFIPFANIVNGQTYDFGFDFASINNFGYDCDVANNGSVDPEVNAHKIKIEVARVEKHSYPYTTLKANGGATDLGSYLASNGWTEPVYASYGGWGGYGDFSFAPSGTSLGTMSTSTPSLQLNQFIQIGESIDQPVVGTPSSETFDISHERFVDTTGGAGNCRPQLNAFNNSPIWPEDILALGDEIADRVITDQFFTGNGRMSNFTTLSEFPFLARVENSNTAVTNDEEVIGIMNPLEVIAPAPSSVVQTDSGDLDITYMTKTAVANMPSGTIKIYLKNDTLGINEHLVDDTISSAGTYNVTIGGSSLATAYNGGVFPSSTDYYVQIESTSGSAGAFSRGYYFSIRANITEIDITSPVGGTDFNQGESVTITWEAQNNLTDSNDPQ